MIGPFFIYTVCPPAATASKTQPSAITWVAPFPLWSNTSFHFEECHRLLGLATLPFLSHLPPRKRVTLLNEPQPCLASPHLFPCLSLFPFLQPLPFSPFLTQAAETQRYMRFLVARSPPCWVHLLAARSARYCWNGWSSWAAARRYVVISCLAWILSDPPCLDGGFLC